MNLENNTQQKKILAIIILLIAVVIGVFAVLRMVKLQNRAATESPQGEACRQLTGTCTIPSTQLQNMPGAVLNDLIANNRLVIKDENGTIIASGESGDLTIEFPAQNGQAYTCTLENNNGGEYAGICLTPAIGTGSSCDGPTPTITVVPTGNIMPSVTPPTTPTVTPEVDECVDCRDGKFECKEPRIIQASTNPSCPALAIHRVSYVEPDLVSCPVSPKDPPPTKLDCSKHKIVIETIPGPNRELTPKECQELKDSGFDLRLHTGLTGDGCRTYEIKAYDEKGDPLKVCETCELKSGCPLKCTVEDLNPAELIDIPDLPENNGECVKDVCELEVSNACGQVTINTFVKSPDGGKLYFDDHYNNPPRIWEDVPTGRTSRQHAYKNSGYYDIVLVCKNPQSTGGQPNQNFICAKRISKACRDDNPPSPTPARSCPALQVELHLECPGESCPTPTQQPPCKNPEDCITPPE
ncbi:hypothetical protein A2690_00635 [Candidatus Roizmanbacteria bacterium RIFCSPHIGHO2_01_FULL_39_12b]|uniref:Uncharacterized protein n=1 Tax=Candidatus Roizmanbacteria bacterium RIFCSPHIGHO2_01_FULL_39_12b TaxID=1802030 RepID=A0A1F7GAZ3_9BACT|nr:MAG: hypothetical protein A2690_00635 [Candidatus Roizmanbacteria bacterium RIFCSPHIGHO2_01_FULL_39_12b]